MMQWQTLMCILIEKIKRKLLKCRLVWLQSSVCTLLSKDTQHFYSPHCKALFVLAAVFIMCE